MKRKILIILGIILLLAIPLVVLFTLKMTGKRFANGIYYAVDCEEYPDAYLVVKGKTLQFYNIDLNAEYGQEQLDDIYEAHNNENLLFRIEISDEELLERADLNNIFVNNPYEYNPEKCYKEGTFIYYYPFMTYSNLMRLDIVYDSWNKTIKIMNYQLQITFKKN